jgi:hypothetical protein
MRTTGRSDDLFITQATSFGTRIMWAASAPVYEDVPAIRMTLIWIVPRQYRLRNTFSVNERVVGTRMRVIK